MHLGQKICSILTKSSHLEKGQKVISMHVCICLNYELVNYTLRCHKITANRLTE